MLFFVDRRRARFRPISPDLALVAVLAMDLVPISVAIAILRYHLYDIDVLIRRTLTYALPSAVLLVAYLTGVALVQVVSRRSPPAMASR